MDWEYEDDWWKEVDEDYDYKMRKCACCNCETISHLLIECPKCGRLVCEDCVNDEEVCAECLYDEEETDYDD